jgi:Pectate lyase superfamily protein
MEGKMTMKIAMTTTRGLAGKRTRAMLAALMAVVFCAALLAAFASPLSAQGSRKDDIVFGPSGHPVAGATIRVCQPTATGSPCSPLANIYTDATLTVPAVNPFQGDGIGNYHFYAAAGRYMIQITGPGITGTITYPDAILAPDLSSSAAGNNISAFGLSLGGNLTVSGNPTITGTLTSSGFNPGVLSPSSLSVGGNESVQGPRPRIDVTAYGAKGDGVTDDTVAITNAINAACALPITNSLAPSVAFPPGFYLVDQTQGSSTTPDLPSCAFLHLEGLGNGAVMQFGSPPQANIHFEPGPNPSPAPVFALTGGGVTIENLGIDGYNQAVWVDGASGVQLRNACLRVVTSGQADNTPLKLTDILWFWMKGGCLETLTGSSANGNLPVALMTAETLGTSGPTDIFVYFQDVIMAGGAIHYSQRVNDTAAPPGEWVFRNITREASNQDFLQVTNDTGNPGNTALAGGVYSVTVDHVNDSDSSSNTAALINFNVSNAFLSGVYINHSFAGVGPGPTEAAIRMTAGTLQSGFVTGCAVYCETQVVDGSGNPVAGAAAQNVNGFDYTVNTSDPDRLRADTFFDTDGPAARFTAAGSRFSGLANDPGQGVLFGDGSSYGYSAQVKQSTRQTLDVGFASTLPPTGVSGSATTGGTLAAGTYYYFISTTSADSGSCDSIANPSAVSLPSGAVTIGGSNNAASISWTPSATPLVPILGYCVVRSATPYFANTSNPVLFVTGASSSTATDTGSNFACCYGWPPVNQLQAVHRFTSTSLGVNNTNPQFNLDVSGTAAVNSLNGVQMADRAAGSDAAAKINACLSAASTTTGVCDARGLSGALTGSSHIQIPAATTLLWGVAQLTINDTTHNDAVELMGDGSALIGYQESGSGTIPRPDSSGFIACQPAGCTTVKNPNAATRNVDWVHITGMNLQATGTGSVVLNLTSVGHSDIENNRFVMGTGGSSFGIFGDTSTGGFDSTNTLIKHNEFDPQFQNDRCLRLAGVFNVIEMEQNTCILPAANTGTVCFEIAKDSSGNYPNNDEFYGNDCEGSTTSFGQIGYNIINADSVTIGPNNRCENVYNCFQFPVDGSAVGIHVLDPYISVSANSVIKANEPSTSQIAIDNNGPNWLPSMHFGMNDLAGPNLIGNAGMEGWQNSTTLFYWGGVSGTNINQAGSGIYAQNTSAGTPADTSTQGTYNVKIGDNATAGLGINSGCIPVDPTMNYSLAFRIAATSTGINFRPGFRFYSDANCTDANKITSVATNARVLTPANYAGYSTLVGTGANWQSSNASLTYNNGITCNCNVTGSDWNVATASAWTPTRNFAITFRAPNAYSSSSTVARSMRVFILENTAANPNQVFVDDVVLSQGPVSPNVPLMAPVSDSGNPSVYGNLTVAGSLTVGSLPATLTSGTPAANDCAAFTSGTVTNIQDSGSPCPTQFTKFAMGFLSAGQAPSANNAVDVSVVYLPNIQFSKLTVDVSTTDASTNDFYSWAITDTSGNVKCSVTAVNLTVGGADDQSCTQGTVTLASGPYIFAFTGNATTGKIAYSGTAPLALSSAVSSTTSSSGAITFPLAVPAAGVTYSGYGLPAIILH